MTTAVLIPAMRGPLLSGLIDNIRATTFHPCAIRIIGTPDVVGHINRPDVSVTTDNGGTWGQRLNRLYAESDEEYLFCGADDLRFHHGWLPAALEAMHKARGVVMVNDLCSDNGTLPFVSRHYLETEGGTVDGTGAIIHEGYHHNFSERELVEAATARGRYAYCPESVVEHLHWMAGKADRSDPVYQLGESQWDADIALFSSRQHLWRNL